MQRFLRAAIVALGTILALLSVVLGAELRGVWVSRWEYSDEAGIREMMAWIAAHGFNVVLFQVRGQGTVYYRSALEPQAEILERTPGWDPLEAAIREAKAQGLELHAWINLFPGWRGEQPHQDPRQLWNSHREWFLRSVDGRQDPSVAEYAFLTPTLPSVRHYLLELVRELWSNYPIDGVHFDYIRYPGPGYGHDPESLSLFFQRSGLRPEEDRRAWDEFRREAITEFLRSVRDARDAQGRELRISAAVLGDYRLGRALFLQDSHQWMSEHLLDAIFPMTYTPDTTRFAREVQEHLVDAQKTLVCPGILVERNPSAAREVAIVRRVGAQGFCLFSYGALRKAAHSDSLLRLVCQPTPSRPSQAKIPWQPVAATPGDRRGPKITSVRLVPDHVPADGSWEVECTLEDPSGILVRTVPPRSPYVIWTTGAPSEGGQVEMLLPLTDRAGRFRSARPLPPVPAGRPVYYRIFAADRSDPDPLRCNWSYTPLARSWTVPTPRRWHWAGRLPEAIWGPRSCAVDGLGQLWVVESLRKRLRVFGPGGAERSFSPLEAQHLLPGTSGSSLALGSVAACSETVYVALRLNGGYLVALDASSGQVLQTASLERPPGDLEVLDGGRFVACVPDGSCWWVFDRTGKTLGPAVCTSHLTQGIAVLPQGKAVLATCRSEDCVHIWRQLDASALLYQPVPDNLPFADIRIGDVEVGADGHVLLCLTGGEAILELDSGFRVVDALTGPLRAPLTLALSPDGRRAYVLEAAGLGPEFVHVFERK
ncbi:MAG: family 10 glycosylhydrolase [candidate division KSB1 bacterium]|nr:family 10 glycosylhydrolase [candidate division KSB1 bacterium]